MKDPQVQSMNEQIEKVKRSANLVKGFMLLVALVELLKVIETDTLDFGSIAGTCAMLSLLRGLLATPELFITPLRKWLRSGKTITKASRKYFLVAAVFLIVAMQ